MREGSLEAPTRTPSRGRTRTSPTWPRSRRRCIASSISATAADAASICATLSRGCSISSTIADRGTRCRPDDGLQKVVDACTLCDMCFMTKCPYVPPHEFNLDFPHLMLRYRAAERKHGKVGLRRPGSWRRPTATASSARRWRRSPTGRPTATTASPVRLLEKAAGIDRKPNCRNMPAAHSSCGAKRDAPEIEQTAPGVSAARRCSTRPASSTTTAPTSAPRRGAVLARNGVETEVVYPACCGMPQLEHGDIAQVATNARKVAARARTVDRQGL